MWIFTSIIIFLYCKTGDCGGTVEVRLLNYDYLDSVNVTSLCCDVKKPGCDACDPVFEISLAELKGPSLSIIKSSQTKQYNNTNHIVFGSTSGAAGGHFFFDFIKFSSKYYLAFKIVDKNITVIDDVRFLVGQGEPSSFKTRTNYTVRTVTGNNTEIKFEYIIKCKTYFYGYCQVYCKPAPKRYTCDNNGRKVCDPGWSGPNCTKHQSGPLCKTTSCQNGATCMETAANTTVCFCTPFFTGKLCDQRITSSNQSTITVPRSPGSSPFTSRISFSTPSRLPILSNSRNVTSLISTTVKPRITQHRPQTTPSTQTSRFVLPAVTLTLDQITFELDTVKPETSPNLTGIIAGSILGSLLILILVTVAVCICKKKWKKTKVNSSEEPPISTVKIENTTG